LLGVEPSLEIGQTPGILLHSRPCYRLGPPESSKYPLLRIYQIPSGRVDKTHTAVIPVSYAHSGHPGIIETVARRKLVGYDECAGVVYVPTVAVLGEEF